VGTTLCSAKLVFGGLEQCRQGTSGIWLLPTPQEFYHAIHTTYLSRISHMVYYADFSNQRKRYNCDGEEDIRPKPRSNAATQSLHDRIGRRNVGTAQHCVHDNADNVLKPLPFEPRLARRLY